jgi:putative membrane protein
MSLFAGILASICSGCPFGGSGGGFSWWIAVVIAVAVIVLALVVYLLVRYIRGGSIKKMAENPLEIAERRYASGEITKEEFEKIKKGLVGETDAGH